MAKPQHRTAEYRATRLAFDKIVKAGKAYCSEPVCKMASRWIPPGTPWHLSHDPSGQVIIGPSHQRCNVSEAATRGNRMRGAKRPRRIL